MHRIAGAVQAPFPTVDHINDELLLSIGCGAGKQNDDGGHANGHAGFRVRIEPPLSPFRMLTLNLCSDIEQHFTHHLASTMPASLENRVKDLSHDQLLELVMDAIKEDSGIRKHFASRLASSTERYSKLKRSIKKLASLKSSNSDKYAKNTLKEIQELIGGVVYLGKSHPPQAFELLCSIQSHQLAIHKAVYDKGGTIFRLFAEDLAKELVASVQRTVDSPTLIAGLRTICFHQPWSPAIDVVEKMAMYLPYEVIDALIPELEAWTDSGPGDPYDSQAGSTSELLQAAIYAGAGRIDDYIRLVSSRGELGNTEHWKIAEMYLDHDDREGAKHHLDMVDYDAVVGSWEAQRVMDRFMATYADPSEIRSYLRNGIGKEYRYGLLDSFRSLFGTEMIEDVLNDVMDDVKGSFGKQYFPPGLLTVLVREGFGQQLAKIVASKPLRLDRLETYWIELSDALMRAGWAAEASLIIRALMNEHLICEDPRELRDAARLFVRLEKMESLVDDWGTIESHVEFAANLADDCECFPAFWRRVEKASGVSDR